eukprot:11795637-Prorocentrum_lima.AAC.1
MSWSQCCVPGAWSVSLSLSSACSWSSFSVVVWLSVCGGLQNNALLLLMPICTCGEPTMRGVVLIVGMLDVA